MTYVLNMQRLQTIKFIAVSGALAAYATLPVFSNAYTPYPKKYFHQVVQKILKNWLKPQIQPDKNVVVVFKIETTGEVKELKCQHSSGSKEWDESALEAVRRSNPFEPIPQDWAAPSMELQYTFDPKRTPAKEPEFDRGMKL